MSVLKDSQRLRAAGFLSETLTSAVLFLLAGVAMLPGCGAPDRATARRAVFPVTGKLSFQGRPTVGALVVLHPLDASLDRQSWAAGFPRGRVAADGSFQLTTYEQNDGAPAGRYVIVVSWNARDAVGVGESERSALGAEGEDWLAGRFADPRVSRLSCVVEGPRADLGRIDLQ